MKTRVALAALAWLAAGTALAGPPHPGRAPDMDRLALLLDLDDSQKAQVKTIFEEQREQMRSARENSTERPSREEMRTRHQQMRKDMVTKLSTVLNEQQLKKFEALTEWRGGPPRERPAQ